jgi:glycosyltransferase involved in cell wall biosynthesis
LKWVALRKSPYQVVIFDRTRKKPSCLAATCSRAVVQLPEGDYSWRVRVQGRNEITTAVKGFRVTPRGELERLKSLKRPVPAGSRRDKLHKSLLRPIESCARRVRARMVPAVPEPRRAARLVEITIFSWRTWRHFRSAHRRKIRGVGSDTLWIAHDLYALPITFLLAKLSGGRLVYDAVELSMGRWLQTPGWLSRRVILAVERLCRRAECVLAGSPYLSEELAARHPRVRPVLFLNAHDSISREAASDYLRTATAQPPDTTIVLFLGAITRGRGLDQIVKAVAHLSEGIHLVMMGSNAAGPPGAELRELATELAIADRITILDPVPQDQIVWAASSADIGISPASRELGNGRYNLNNKLFQYIAAGLPVLASNVEGVGRFALSEQIGDVFDERDPRSIAECINKTVADPARLAEIRARLPAVAKKYSWEAQRKVLLDALSQVEARQGRA